VHQHPGYAELDSKQLCIPW